jgi:DNA-binding transcriptional LysR family regulator
VELRDIEIFLTLAEELHFGRTAERLHVTPARVSQAIKKQERVIGAALFERTSRVVRLTPVGEQLRDELEIGYRQIRQAIGGTAAAVRGVSGTVRVGFSGPWCGDLIVKAAEVFQDRFPACTVQVVGPMPVLAEQVGDLAQPCGLRGRVLGELGVPIDSRHVAPPVLGGITHS